MLLLVLQCMQHLSALAWGFHYGPVIESLYQRPRATTVAPPRISMHAAAHWHVSPHALEWGLPVRGLGCHAFRLCRLDSGSNYKHAGAVLPYMFNLHCTMICDCYFNFEFSLIEGACRW
jgi:hypothetical protein